MWWIYVLLFGGVFLFLKWFPPELSTSSLVQTQMLDVTSGRSSRERVRQCSVCGDSIREWPRYECYDCAMFLCRACEADHNGTHQLIKYRQPLYFLPFFSAPAAIRAQIGAERQPPTPSVSTVPCSVANSG